jgi:dihydropteroate synthase
MRVKIMGIVNRTPDSFFDGGQYLDDAAAHVRVDQLVEAGADIIDVGCESTRPGAPAVSAAEQKDRLGALIAYIASHHCRASVDTTSPEVAAHAVTQGATVINSVALEPAAELGRLAAQANADLVLTHCRGSMTAMAGFSAYADDAYGDVVDDVLVEWEEAARRAAEAGLSRDRLIFDPGLGFTKNAAQSLELCARLGELKRRLGGVRVLVGPSRKSYIATTVAAELGSAPPSPAERLGGTIAAVLDCVARGADIVRVHDVAETAQALAYAEAMGARAATTPRKTNLGGHTTTVAAPAGSDDRPSKADIGGGGV